MAIDRILHMRVLCIDFQCFAIEIQNIVDNLDLFEPNVLTGVGIGITGEAPARDSIRLVGRICGWNPITAA